MVSSSFRPCILIPTFNNPATIRRVVERVRRDNPSVPIIVIDDHSGPDGQRAVVQLAEDGLALTRRLAMNLGKGGALKIGFQFALEFGFTHALQIDADGQHCFEDIPRFLEASRRHPEALIVSNPIFDSTAPKARLIGRKISIFWTTLETGFRRLIDDPLCGFRVYPLVASIASGTISNRMEFDPEIAVRMAWNGVPILNLDTRVRYLTAEEGGISHFHPFRDNWRMSLMHTRLVFTLLGKMIAEIFGKKRPAMSRITLEQDDFRAVGASDFLLQKVDVAEENVGATGKKSGAYGHLDFVDRTPSPVSNDVLQPAEKIEYFECSIPGKSAENSGVTGDKDKGASLESDKSFEAKDS